MTAPARPILRYHGGKARLGAWIVGHFPAHRTYIEPYGGAASVLLQKERAYAEIYNDLDGEVVNVFRVMRDPVKAEVLTTLLRLTPFAREEFEAAYQPGEEATDIERARCTIVKSFMGFGSASIHDLRPRGMRTAASTWRPPTGFRNNSDRSGTTPAQDWRNYPDHLAFFCQRLQGVVIENRRAIEVIMQHQRPDALIYCDPPYLHETRSGFRWPSDRQYTHEMTEGDHRDLAAVLRASPAKVIVSGYQSELYDELYHDWLKVQKSTHSERAKERVETLWINWAADEQLRLV